MATEAVLPGEMLVIDPDKGPSPSHSGSNTSLAGDGADIRHLGSVMFSSLDGTDKSIRKQLPLADFYGLTESMRQFWIMILITSIF
jgi:hypothetical protein